MTLCNVANELNPTGQETPEAINLGTAADEGLLKPKPCREGTNLLLRHTRGCVPNVRTIPSAA